MAAGAASRFGSDKLTARIGGRSLIERALDAVPPGLFSAVAVVTGRAEIGRMARERGHLWLPNREPECGVSHTIRLGTRALADCHGILYLVADQPLLSPGTVRRVVGCWQENPEKIVGAASGGVRGNPCMFPRALFPELEALEGDRGGAAVIRAHPELLLLVEAPRGELVDVDTPDALEALRRER